MLFRIVFDFPVLCAGDSITDAVLTEVVVTMPYRGCHLSAVSAPRSRRTSHITVIEVLVRNGYAMEMYCSVHDSYNKREYSYF